MTRADTLIHETFVVMGNGRLGVGGLLPPGVLTFLRDGRKRQTDRSELSNKSLAPV